jgi:hypothetical protein
MKVKMRRQITARGYIFIERNMSATVRREYLFLILVPSFI